MIINETIMNIKVVDLFNQNIKKISKFIFYYEKLLILLFVNHYYRFV